MTPRDLSGVLLGGRYRVQRLIGAGGMGAVYEAVQEDLGRRVAVKVVYDELAYREEAIARFRREAQAAAALGHPNIVQVTDFQAGPPAFLVMELLQGMSLGAAIAQGPLPIARVVLIATQVLAALSAAHRAGLVHRDIKPDNVFLTANAVAQDLVKLLDFGVVKQDAPNAPQLTATGAMIGSPAYMAPEQLRGRPVDARADLYAVGVCMYTALTGRLPFRGTSLPELVFAIDEQTPPPIAESRPDVPAPLAQIILRAMAKNPDARFRTADEMSAAIAPWMGASPTSPVAASVMAMPSPAYGRTPPTSPAVRAKSSAGLVLVLVGIALVVCGVLLFTAVIEGRANSRHAAENLAADARAHAFDPVATGSAPELDAASPGSLRARDAAVPHVPSGNPSPSPAPLADDDGGSSPYPAQLGATRIDCQGSGPYHVEHINFVAATLVARIDHCAAGVPAADFEPGSVVNILADTFDVSVGKDGQVTSIAHPSDSFSRTFDGCVRPILQGAAWGKPSKPGMFVVTVRTTRKH